MITLNTKIAAVRSHEKIIFVMLILLVISRIMGSAGKKSTK